MRTFFRTILILVLCVGIWYGYLVWQNNRDIPPPAAKELEESLNAGIEWLVRNEDSILDQNNPMLWWMVQRSAELSGDSRLGDLFSKYSDRYLEDNANYYWRPLFVKNSWVPIRFENIKSLPYYNLQYLYAVTCDSDLAIQPEIRAQNSPDFCFNNYPFSPACLTHQLIGMRLLQINACGKQDHLERTVHALQKKIRWQLTWDVRVVDVYLQRVMMLVESGARDMVKPVWVRNVLTAQRKDGGWSGLVDPLFSLIGGYQFGFGQRGFTVSRKIESDFHATPQGVLLLVLLLRTS